MSISSQLPPIPLAQASATLRALAQAAGQTLEARVLGQNANGTTQIQIGRQTLSLMLPSFQPPGATLSLSVQQAEGQLRLALVSVRPPPVSGGGATTVPPAPPATTIQLSPAAQSAPGLSPAQPAPLPAAGMPAGVSSTAQPTMPAQPAVNAPSPPSGMPTAPLSAGTASAIASNAGASAAGNTAMPTPAAPVSAATAPAAGQAAPMANGNSAPGRGTGPVPVTAAPAGAGTAKATIPYPAAAPVIGTPAAVPPGTATSALPPIQQVQAGTVVGQHASASAPPAQPSVPPAPPSSQPTAQTLRAALTQMVQHALPRQDSILGLTTALAAARLGTAVPEPVRKAAQQVLGHRLALDGGRLDGAAVQRAVQGSGLFQEAMLAAGRPATAGADLKSALLNLRRGLASWLGDQAPVEQVARVPPPVRGALPRARAGEAPPPELPADPVEAGRHLLERTEAALSRLRLHQNASLPETGFRAEAQWSLDLPVTVAGQQALLHLQIHQDAEEAATRGEERGWQVRFAINLAELGEVGAQISLRASTAGVLLWAERQETTELLAAGIEALREELRGVGLLPGALVVRAGAPAQAAAMPSGHVVDAMR